jgi:hypothetical protein
MLDKTELYGKRIQKFQFELKGGKFSKFANEVTINNKHPNVSPASGCDIIIHDSSTTSDRILAVNPELVRKTHLMSYTSESVPDVSLFGYCDATELDALFEAYKVRAKDLLKDYVEQLRKVTSDIDIILK